MHPPSRSILILVSIVTCCHILFVWQAAWGDDFRRISFNNPELVVDLGVGLWAWPLPMDWDDDGDFDLVVVCPDKPYNGTYVFENPNGDKLPTFRASRRIGQAVGNAQICWVDQRPLVLSPGNYWPEFRQSGFQKPVSIFPNANIHPNKVRANQWKFVDYENDGDLDLLVGVGDWTDYGWDDAYDAQGIWTRGPLRGFVYLIENQGTNLTPDYAEPQKLHADNRPIEVFGMPSPNLADFDGDGDLDLICGEFLDGFTYFENVGSQGQPRFATGRKLGTSDGPLKMNLQMITPTGIDWDRDGDVDLIVGDEDGRVALIEHTGQMRDQLPQFLPPQYFRQHASDVKFGALATPFNIDWDQDGDDDLICGNTAGYIGWIENLDGQNPPKWAAPRYLESNGQPIRILAGENGSIQGPAEAKWGYTTLSVNDWDQDGKLDIVANSIWGKVVWFRNSGTPQEPNLESAQPVHVTWDDSPSYPSWNWWKPAPHELVTQWRTTPFAIDLNDDTLIDLVMLDHEGYLAWFPRERLTDDQLTLRPGRRVFLDADTSSPLQLNSQRAGRSGRRKFTLVDWDQDGDLDLLANAQNVELWENTSGNAPLPWHFKNQGLLGEATLAGHTTSPTTVDWNHDGIPELLVGAEDGYLYYLPREP